MMGKKQHSKDRMFITKTEWATEWGGAKSKESRTRFKRLPFYCCSPTFTPFELLTDIVAMKTTGNVLCYEAIKELNIKTKNWKELLTDESFTKQDIITFQNQGK
ncbi:hypothetical protein V6N13_052659 [Hibiscus sabdariffa]